MSTEKSNWKPSRECTEAYFNEVPFVKRTVKKIEILHWIQCYTGPCGKYWGDKKTASVNRRGLTIWTMHFTLAKIGWQTVKASFGLCKVRANGKIEFSYKGKEQGYRICERWSTRFSERLMTSNSKNDCGIFDFVWMITTGSRELQYYVKSPTDMPGTASDHKLMLIE